jgi:signal transduction histidine kinase
MTIRKRIALWYSGLLTLLIVIFGIAVITFSRVTLLNTVDYVLISTSQNIADSIIPVNTVGFAEPARIEISYQAEKVFHIPGISVQIWRTFDNGQNITPILERVSDDIVGFGRPLDSTFIHSTERTMNSILMGDIPARVITQPFYAIDKQQLGVVQVATPLNTVANANDQLILVTIASATICIVLSIGFGLWLSRHLLKPIDKITATAASIAQAEDLSTRIQWDGTQDELGQLAAAFNHTMGRLEHLFKVQQRFIGDVSHELRTPLTSILGHLEIMDRYGFDQDSLDAAHREADRMSRMINDLLLLTRADSGELQVDLYPIDLDTIAVEVHQQAIELAKGRQLEIVLERVAHVRIHGNSDRIRQLLLNLLHNAIKFTNDGGKITLSVYQEGQTAIITVQDTGMGISEKDLESIFAPFFQADEARVHHSESDGAGLGLSIVNWIVKLHRGKITVTSTQGKGSLFHVCLPIQTLD